MFSVIFDARYGAEQTDRFVDSLKLFKIGFSWGGAHSLCVPYHMASIRKHWNEAGQCWCASISGLEDADDLIADIEQALDKLA